MRDRDEVRPGLWVVRSSGSVFAPSSEKVRCPWHQEKTPSCYINWETGVVHCFGCGKVATTEEYLKYTNAGSEADAQD